VLGNVLEGIFVFFGAHGGFAKNELTIGFADGQVAALFVIFRALAALHQKGGILFRKVG